MGIGRTLYARRICVHVLAKRTAMAYGSVSRVNNPIAGGTIGRTDQGVDISASPGAALYDPVPGVSQLVGRLSGWYRGQPFYWFKVLTGKFKGRFWYAAEQVDISTPQGGKVSQGQRIGQYASSGTATEWGWATPSGATLAHATSGYTEGQVTPAGTDFLTEIIKGSRARTPQVNWKPCLLTWYDPALGGINTTGAANPHASTASGEPYNANADTCAAPPQYKFGTILTFQYQGKTVTCKVNDRGGAIVGSHFDLSRHAAETLGMINSGAVPAQFVVGTANAPTDQPTGKTRPGGQAADSGQSITDLFKAYQDELDAPRTAPADVFTSLGGNPLTAPFQWWLNSFTGRWEG